MKIYNIGVPLTTVMLAVRGITQVLDVPFRRSGCGHLRYCWIKHILIGIGLILLLMSLKKTAKD